MRRIDDRYMLALDVSYGFAIGDVVSFCIDGIRKYAIVSDARDNGNPGLEFIVDSKLLTYAARYTFGDVSYSDLSLRGVVSCLQLESEER